MLAIILNTTNGVSLNNDFNWTLGDYLMALFLIGGMIAMIYAVHKKVRRSKYSYLAIIAVMIITLVIWIDLAVGLFGLPWSGS